MRSEGDQNFAIQGTGRLDWRGLGAEPELPVSGQGRVDRLDHADRLVEQLWRSAFRDANGRWRRREAKYETVGEEWDVRTVVTVLDRK